MSTSSRSQPNLRQTNGSLIAMPCTRVNGIVCDVRDNSPRSMRSPPVPRDRVKSHCCRIRFAMICASQVPSGMMPPSATTNWPNQIAPTMRAIEPIAANRKSSESTVPIMTRSGGTTVMMLRCSSTWASSCDSPCALASRTRRRSRASSSLRNRSDVRESLPPAISIRSSARPKTRATSGSAMSTDWMRSYGMRRDALVMIPLLIRSSVPSMT